MKINFRVYFWLTALSVVVTAVFLALMPDTVPMHYDAAGVVDRFGSKYEQLLFPLCIAGTALIFAALVKSQAQQANQKVFFYTGLITLLFFNVIFTYFLWQALTYDAAAAEMRIDVNRISVIAIGVTMAALGSIMPKAQRNSLFGLRTSWSMSSDTVWQKSQRFGGISSVVTGLTMCLLAVVLEGMSALLASLGLITVWVILCLVVSRRYYLQEQAKK